MPFAIGIKYRLDVTVQGPHDADARKYRRPARCRDQDQGLHCSLPLRGLMLGFRKLRRVGTGVLESDEPAPAGELDRRSSETNSFPSAKKRQNVLHQ